MAIHPIILSGGSGTRLWPLSRRAYPKQLLRLTGDDTLLQATAVRVGDPETFAPPLVVCNQAHRFIIAEQLRAKGIEPMAIALEPAARNTAPAVTAAALMVLEQDPEGVLLVLPSDHVIGDTDAFQVAVMTAEVAARRGSLVTFGVVPEHPETGFGYIRRGTPIAGLETRSDVENRAFTVAEFVEKPGQDLAEVYVAGGEHYWNSGMFVFTAAALLGEMERFQPEVVAACRKAVEQASRDLTFTRLDKQCFAASPSISIDHAVMEHTTSAAVIGVDMAWNDIGSWNALWEIGDTDDAGNVTSGDVITRDVTDSYLRSETRLIGAVGLDNMVIIETDDAVMVTPRHRAQEVKEIVSALEDESRSEAKQHSRVYRPWGSHEGIAEGPRFQVKQISVRPGHKISLQKHHHRAEHWIVVQGTALVTKGDEETLLTENQSTYIPIGVPHRLENPGEIELTLIEVQSGPYLGEDDINRLEDIYGRGDRPAD